MATAYGKSPVLAVLPLCVKGDALEWYTGLNCGTTNRMAESLAVWKDQLRRRFASDAMEALDEAHCLRFRWDREDQMDLRQYVSRKVLLLEEAGILDEDQQVRLIWRGLDANLMATVAPLAGGGNTLDGFTEELYQHEYPAKRLWKESHRTTTAAPRARPAEPAVRYQTGPPLRDSRNEVPGARIPAREKGAEWQKPTIPPERRVTFPRQRERDCRHCGGPHMDYDCPTRNAERGGRPVRAYLLEPDIPENERLVELDYTPRQDNREVSTEGSEEREPAVLEEPGNDRNSHARVDMM